MERRERPPCQAKWRHRPWRSAMQGAARKDQPAADREAAARTAATHQKPAARIGCCQKKTKKTTGHKPENQTASHPRIPPPPRRICAMLAPIAAAGQHAREVSINGSDLLEFHIRGLDHV